MNKSDGRLALSVEFTFADSGLAKADWLEDHKSLKSTNWHSSTMVFAGYTNEHFVIVTWEQGTRTVRNAFGVVLHTTLYQ